MLPALRWVQRARAPVYYCEQYEREHEWIGMAVAALCFIITLNSQAASDTISCCFVSALARRQWQGLVEPWCSLLKTDNIVHAKKQKNEEKSVARGSLRFFTGINGSVETRCFISPGLFINKTHSSTNEVFDFTPFPVFPSAAAMSHATACSRLFAMHFRIPCHSVPNRIILGWCYRTRGE